MIAWLVLSLMTAALNLFVFLAVRGRWGAVVPLLAAASLLGTIAGNAVGGRLALGILRIGDFELLAASLGAQLAMLAMLLLSAMAPPTSPPPADPS